MPICPFANYRPVNNHGGAMTGHIGLVMHVQEGNNSLAGWFNNPSSGVSAHFWCSKTGVLEQYIDTTNTAWAQAAGNAQYLSVETEGFVAEPLTNDQITMVARLLQWSAGVYKFPIAIAVAHGLAGFTSHCNPNGTPDPAWGNHTCPGTIRLNQMPAIVSLAKGQPTPSPQPPTEEDFEEMDSTIVTINGIDYLVTHGITSKGHWLEIRREIHSIGLSSVGANTSIIDLTASWPQISW